MVTEEEWSAEIARNERLRWLSLGGGLIVVAAIFIPCIMAGEAVATGWTADLLSAGLMIAILGPMSAGLIIVAARQQAKTDQKLHDLTNELSEAVASADR